MTHHEGHEVDHDAAVDRLPDSEAAKADDAHAHAPNPTQEGIDEDPGSGKPVDVGWEDDAPA